MYIILRDLGEDLAEALVKNDSEIQQREFHATVDDLIFKLKGRPYPFLPSSGFAGCTKGMF